MTFAPTVLPHARDYDALYRQFRWQVPQAFNIGAAVCDGSEKCCLDGEGGATCIALTASCPAVAARCDGVEDCGVGACCAPMLGDIQCGEATCENQICRENVDCVDRAARLCCLGIGLKNQPWGFCSDVCLTVE